MASRESEKTSSAQQTLDGLSVQLARCAWLICVAVLYDISQLLNTQLDREILATCVSMIESGVNPEALAVSPPCPSLVVASVVDPSQTVIKELRRENASLNNTRTPE